MRPSVNQVLAHIGQTPFDVIDHARSKGILTEAYSPFGHGEILNHELIGGIARKYDVGVPQLAVRYLLQLGLLPLPKTVTPAHMRTNAAVDFIIGEDDMEALRSVDRIKDYGEASKFPVFAKA